MCIYIYINYNNRSKNGVEELVQMDLGARPRWNTFYWTNSSTPFCNIKKVPSLHCTDYCNYVNVLLHQMQYPRLHFQHTKHYSTISSSGSSGLSPANNPDVVVTTSLAAHVLL